MSGRLDKNKKYKDFNQSQPVQLSLFYNLPQERDYSSTIELYDTLPKYHYGNQKREIGKQGEYLPILERNFKYQDADCKLNISPAAIVKNGKTINYYPSQREELVEDALRKMACDGRGLFLDDEMGFSFSLYEVQQELESKGHGYNINQIKEALYICARCNIELKSEDNDISFTAPIFTSLGLKGTNKHTQTFVRFNPLVSKSIKEQSFRQLNYPKYMEHKKMLTRWLHKRLSHYFIQASHKNSYTTKLSTIVTSSGMEFHSKITNTRGQIITSLEELVKNKVLIKYDYTNLQEGQRKNKITDVLFQLTPDESFIEDVIQANLRKIAEKNKLAKNCG
jgi:hypothetical protein